jgi:hypothetical protein
MLHSTLVTICVCTASFKIKAFIFPTENIYMISLNILNIINPFVFVMETLISLRSELNL